MRNAELKADIIAIENLYIKENLEFITVFLADYPAAK